MGTGYKGNADHYHTVSENIPAVSKNYEYHDGYFGKKGSGDISRVRNITNEDPIADSKNFYDTLTKGAIEYDMPNGKGKFARMEDGTVISYREVSGSDGSPAVDINISNSRDSGGLKKQKIHFVKGDKK